MAPFVETPALSLLSNPRVEVSNEPDLLDGWWNSENIFSLERRAIFSKAWICISHRSRFTKPGDYISLELAGFPIVIILGKDRIARAFHNVCRHRAYTITKKPAGSSLVLGCRYHGWSYDTRGNLVKAPQFDGIAGFDKSQNGLFKIRTCTDRGGFIHINLDASCITPAQDSPGCEELVGFAAEHDISAQSTFITGWELNGEFNWKVVESGDRTEIGTPTNIATDSLSLLDYMVRLFRRPTMNLASTSIPPTTTLLSFPNSPLWATLTTLPNSATQCTVKCDIFSTANPDSSLNANVLDALEALFTSYIHSIEQKYAEMKNKRVSEEPEILPILKAHLKLERAAGREILVARREEGRSEGYCRAEKVCKELDRMARIGKCDAGESRGLDW
ncbi:ISP domain-containing protein [Zopfia rhizophila CBS 207.26]|uniref:ISP domain-containing protein n=1 Tax=Zopfia rhizophila CBS 207.26 TaxID=1314779 RepID=A0A6A6DUT1_9PEZI|nr:ISP domain-containing protein [Zopfia rhizophila CBS 207.26]